MEYFGKTTVELSDKEFDELAKLFNHVFSRNITPQFLITKYTSPLTGFSYHGLMYNDEGTIVGAISFIPFKYQYFGNEIIVGSAADLMIHELYRKDLYSFKHIHDQAIKRSNNTLDFVLAVPNQNPYLYFKKLLGWHDIGVLNYYIQVLNISKIKRQFSGLNWMSGILSSAQNLLFLGHGSKNQAKSLPISKISGTAYSDYRFGDKYFRVTRGNDIAYYSIYDESGINTAYIIDIQPFTKNWMGRVVKEIHSREKKRVDIIMYIGNNLRVPINLIKVPRKFEPRTLHLIGKCLSGRVDQRIFSLSNWKFNLSDFDVR